MRTSALEQLASKGIVTIQKKRESWLVEFIRKDEAGYLTDRQVEWGRELGAVIKELWQKVRNAD